MKWNNEEKPMKKNVRKWNGNVLIRYSRKKFCYFLPIMEFLSI